MRRIIPYLAIAALIGLIIYSLETYRRKNPIKVEPVDWYIPCESTID